MPFLSSRVSALSVHVLALVTVPSTTSLLIIIILEFKEIKFYFLNHGPITVDMSIIAILCQLLWYFRICPDNGKFAWTCNFLLYFLSAFWCLGKSPMSDICNSIPFRQMFQRSQINQSSHIMLHCLPKTQQRLTAFPKS